MSNELRKKILNSHDEENLIIAKKYFDVTELIGRGGISHFKFRKTL